MADECHGALDLPTESLDFTHGFSWTLHTEEALCRQLAETYKKFDFNSITNKSVLPPSVCLFYLNAWQ